MSLGRVILALALAASLALTSAVEAAGGSVAKQVAEQAFKKLYKVFSSSAPERFPKIDPNLWTHLSDYQKDALMRLLEGLPTTRSIRQPRFKVDDIEVTRRERYLDNLLWVVDQHVWREWSSGETFRPDRRSKRCLSRAARKILTQKQRELLVKRVVQGLPQEAVGEAWNIRRQTVSRWEKGLKSEAMQERLRGAYEACVAHQRAGDLSESTSEMALGNVVSNGVGRK